MSDSGIPSYWNILFSLDHIVSPFEYKKDDSKTLSIATKKTQVVALSILAGIATLPILGLGGLAAFYMLTAKHKFDVLEKEKKALEELSVSREEEFSREWPTEVDISDEEEEPLSDKKPSTTVISSNESKPTEQKDEVKEKDDKSSEEVKKEEPSQVDEKKDLTSSQPERKQQMLDTTQTTNSVGSSVLVKGSQNEDSTLEEFVLVEDKQQKLRKLNLALLDLKKAIGTAPLSAQKIESTLEELSTTLSSLDIPEDQAESFFALIQQIEDSLQLLKDTTLKTVFTTKKKLDEVLNKINKLLSDVIPLHKKDLSKIRDPNFEEVTKQAIMEDIGRLLTPNLNVYVDDLKIYPKEKVEEVLVDLYGKPLVADIFRFYFMEKESYLSMQDVQALLIGTVTNVTLKDLQYMMESKAWDRVGNDTLKEAFKKARKEELTNDTLMALLEQIRNVQLPPPNELTSFKGETRTQYLSDLHRLEGFTQIDDYAGYGKDEKMKPYASKEYAARVTAYNLYDNPNNIFTENTSCKFRDGLLAPHFDISSDGKVHRTVQQVHDIFSEQDSGLYVAVMYPALLKQQSGETIPAQILFRGSLDNASWARDFGRNERASPYWLEGPGRKTFETNKEKMFKKLSGHFETICKVTKKPIHYIGAGHSLGASDTARFAETVFANYLDMASKDLLNIGKGGSQLPFRIESAEFHMFNPPRVEDDVAEQLSEAVRKFERLGLQSDVYFYLNTSDPVSWAGGYLIGKYKGKKPTNLTSTIFYFESSEMKGVHTDPLLKVGAPTKLIDVCTNNKKVVGVKYEHKAKVKEAILDEGRTLGALQKYYAPRYKKQEKPKDQEK